MIIKEVTQMGNPMIRKKSKRLSKSEIKLKETKNIIKDLTDSMRHYNLVGMSAPQIDHNLRVFVTEIRNKKNRKVDEIDNLRVFINPKITSYSKGKILGYEGCGSVSNSNIFGLVNRSKSIKIEALDMDGKLFKLSASGLLARVIQHEYDHLDGILFIDKVTDTKSLMSGTEYRKMRNK